MNIKKLASQLLLASTLFVSSASFATLLTGGLNVDNSFSAYISTDDNVQGTLIGSGHDWTSTINLTSTTLLDGQNYFLHIAAENHGGPAGFLGDFTLAGADHVFDNGSNFITTNLNDWQVSTTGWNSYNEVFSHGFNGSTTWGSIPGVSFDATWIWTENYIDNSNHSNPEQVYFTLAINAVNSQTVPEPSIIALLGFGLLGLSFLARRKAK